MAEYKILVEKINVVRTHNRVTQEDLDAYLAHLQKKWRDWCGACAKGDKVEQARLDSYGVDFEYGNKFIKATSYNLRDGVKEHRGAHSFICIDDTGKFKAGDILMAASWRAPAKNKARGNVIARNFGRSDWTGAGYL